MLLYIVSISPDARSFDPNENKSLNEADENILSGLHFENTHIKIQRKAPPNTPGQTIDHTPKPLYAITTPMTPVVSDDETDILACVLKSIFIVNNACWTIQRELNIRVMAVTLIKSASKGTL